MRKYACARLISPIFIYGAVTNGYTLGSPELNRAFFEAVASTIVTIIMFVLALNPVGAVVAAVLGIFDLIFNLTCELGVSWRAKSLASGLFRVASHQVLPSP